MLLAGLDVEPKAKRTGFRMVSVTNLATDGSSVAEKHIVCRVLGKAAVMRRILGYKPHVEHAVGFVEYQGPDAAQINQTAAHEVLQAAGRSYQQARSVAKRGQLGSL